VAQTDLTPIEPIIVTQATQLLLLIVIIVMTIIIVLSDPVGVIDPDSIGPVTHW